MFRLALDETDLDDWFCKRIQNEVIERNYTGATRLNLRDARVRYCVLVEPWTRWLARISAVGDVSQWVWSRGVSEASLEIAFRRPNGKYEAKVLPTLASGWFMLLYDILKLAREPWIVGERFTTQGLEAATGTWLRVVLRDVGRVELRFPWNTPAFLTFFDTDVFCERWREFLERVKGVDPHPPMLAAAWIDCANAGMGKRRRWDPIESADRYRLDDAFAKSCGRLTPSALDDRPRERKLLDRLVEQKDLVEKDGDGYVIRDFADPDAGAARANRFEKEHVQRALDGAANLLRELLSGAEKPSEADKQHRDGDAAQRVLAWLERDAPMHLMPEVVGDRALASLTTPFFESLQEVNGIDPRAYYGRLRFDRLRRALEQALRAALMRDGDPSMDPVEDGRRPRRKIVVHPVGSDRPLHHAPLEVKDAASVLAQWLLGTGGPFDARVIASRGDIDQFEPLPPGQP
jgi:hypothetical protein